MTIQELITALEQAKGPSRELDAEIAAIRLIDNDLYDEADPMETGKVNLYKDGKRVSKVTASKFTSSIDAALTLVPEGSEWQVTNIYGRNQAEVDLNSGHGSYSSGCKNHPATPAIAVCIAALCAKLGDTT